MRRVSILLILAALGPVLPVRAGASALPVTTIVGPRAVCCTDGIAFAGGSLYVDQAALDSLLKIDPATGAITTLAGEADDSSSELITPDDLWIDPVTGDIYQTEILVGGVRKITPQGARSRIVAGLVDDAAFPNAITGLRRPGQPLRLFVSLLQFEPGRRTGVYEVDPAGVVPPRLVYGAVADHDVIGHGLAAPEAFAFDPAGAELYVPEAYGGAVIAINVDAGTARTVFAGGPSRYAVSVRFDRDGTLLYADQGSGEVLRLDPHGAPTQVPALVATTRPGLDGIAVAPDGTIYTTNFRVGGIDVIAPDGSVTEMFARGLDLPNGLARLDDGRLAVGDLAALATVDPSTGAIARIKNFITDNFDIAVGVAQAGPCEVFATGFFRGTLQHVDICDPTKTHTEVIARHTFVAPWDIATGAGFLWMTDAVGLVYRISTDGDLGANAVPLGGAFSNPTGIAFRDGLIYVAESGAGQVRVIGATTGRTAKIIGNLSEPEGIAFDAKGQLLVVEAGAGKLTQIGTDGMTRTTLADHLPTDIRGVSAVPGLNFYSDVLVQPDGGIILSLPKTGEILRLG